MKSILTDITKCIGCNACVAACTESNGLGKEVAYRWRSKDGLSSERFTSVLRKKGYHVRKQCRHCLEPACVSVCPVGALKKTPEGPVIYDDTRCLGCRYCMMACPFGIPRYLWSSPVPYVRKCTMCYSTRLSQGRQPACTEACPQEATIFGERDALLEEARRRISDNPKLYLPKVFGENEVGGTAVLYLSPIELDFLSLGKPVGDRPMPERTALAMAAVPPAFLGMGALMGGVYWVIERRRRLQKDTTVAKDDKMNPPRRSRKRL